MGRPKINRTHCKKCLNILDGKHRVYCRKCLNKIISEWRKNNPEKVKDYWNNWVQKNRNKKRKKDKEYQRKRRAENPGLKKEEYKKYREKYPKKVKAQQLVNKAIIKGELKRLPCEVCGKEKTHGHHDDYSKPLEVRWFCPVHHKAVH